MAIEEIKSEKVNQNQRNIPLVEPILCAPSIFLYNDTFKPSTAEEYKIQIANEKMRNMSAKIRTLQTKDNPYFRFF